MPASTTLHEAADVIGSEIVDRHRAIVSLGEELEAIDGAIVMSRRGGDFEIVSSNDLAVSCVSHDPDKVVLRLDESLTFIDLTPDAAIALRY